MKFSTIAATAALTLSGVQAADADFVTALVSDYLANTQDYYGFILTAGGYPPELIELATAVPTYTDDSYTTILDAQGVAALKSYAPKFPWYSARLAAAAAEPTADETTSEAKTTASAEPISSEAVSSAPVSSAPQSSSQQSSARPTSASVSSFEGAGVNVVAPLGALVGAVAIALM